MTTKRFEPTAGQYSKCVRHGDTLYLSGLIADNWDGDITEQSVEIFEQIDRLLNDAGASKSSLVTVTVFLASFDDYAAFKRAWGEWIDPAALPARATVRADLLDPKLKVEIMVLASAPGAQQ